MRANNSDPAPVANVIANADNVLASFSGKLPYDVKSSSSIGDAMTTDASLLDGYNNSLLTPGCIQ